MSAARAAVIMEGDRVKVISLGLGFEHAYYAARVISPFVHGRCTIRYEKLMQENNPTKALEEEAPMGKLRPYPKAIPQWSYFHGEIMDGYVNDGWWLGRTVRSEGERYIIQYEDWTFWSHAFEYIRLH